VEKEIINDLGVVPCIICMDHGKRWDCELFINSIDQGDYEIQWILGMAIEIKEADGLTAFDWEPFKSMRNMKSKYKPCSQVLFNEIQ